MRPVYQPRNIRCYAVSESELKQIGLSNILITAFFGIGSALIAFALDVDKDLFLSNDTPENVADLASWISTLCWIFGLAFYALTGGVAWWRRDLLKQIKEETETTPAS